MWGNIVRELHIARDVGSLCYATCMNVKCDNIDGISERKSLRITTPQNFHMSSLIFMIIKSAKWQNNKYKENNVAYIVHLLGYVFICNLDFTDLRWYYIEMHWGAAWKYHTSLTKERYRRHWQ